ncbi:MAG: YifB family Mg chelatase-like AAA ATPase [Deltaproteobacteria bacterium]|nr:YifB family Mg chelatase-like AAA ATPase [Deltaproteobacteria bacterium]
MLARVLSSALIGVDAFPIEVEVDISRGLPSFSTVGLPDNAIKESKDRVRSAIKNSGYDFPAKRITVNLAPADIKKEGTSFDLPVAVGILVCEGVVKKEGLKDCLISGELSLDGSIRPIKGAISIAEMAKGFSKKAIVPKENSTEAALVTGLAVIGVGSLGELVEFLNNRIEIAPTNTDAFSYFGATVAHDLDLADVKGQGHVKRALEVAAAGGHNVLMVGPPGSGKTMLARRLSTILPQMSIDEAIETTKVHSVAGLLDGKGALVTKRPFRNPHHTISDAGLIGGGQVPRPGEVSLAHNGVLFLDELPEFRKNVLEALRQPVEDGVVTISRAALSITYPARFMLVSAMNPCPCGHFGDEQKECACTTREIRRYRRRLSGPLLDRIDIHCDVPAVRFRELGSKASGEGSAEVKGRVDGARRIQAERFKGYPTQKDKKVFSNADMRSRHIKKYAEPDDEGRRILEMSLERFHLSARAYTRILKVARTIADLEGSVDIKAHHISEAIQYRTLDRENLL